MPVSSVIRIILTLGLMYFIYKETGWATTLFCFLSMIGYEAQGWLNREYLSMFKTIAKKR